MVELDKFVELIALIRLINALGAQSEVVKLVNEKLDYIIDILGNVTMLYVPEYKFDPAKVLIDAVDYRVDMSASISFEEVSTSG